MGLNAVLGLIIVITICCTLGDLQTVLEGNTQLPFIQIIYNATADHALTRALLCIVIVSIKASVTTGIATSSRQLWSFSRDQGVPFSSVFAYVRFFRAPYLPPANTSQVSPRWNIPLNAMIASQVIITLLSLVNIISHQALNVITTISNTAGISSLILSIGCLLLKRLRGESLPPRRWSLGRFGLLCNVMGLAFLISVFVFTFLSWGPNPGLDINWGAVMYAGVVAFASVYYYFRGRYNFIAPVALVKREVVASLELRHSQN